MSRKSSDKSSSIEAAHNNYLIEHVRKHGGRKWWRRNTEILANKSVNVHLKEHTHGRKTTRCTNTTLLINRHNPIRGKHEKQWPLQYCTALTIPFDVCCTMNGQKNTRNKEKRILQNKFLFFNQPNGGRKITLSKTLKKKINFYD